MEIIIIGTATNAPPCQMRKENNGTKREQLIKSICVRACVSVCPWDKSNYAHGCDAKQTPGKRGGSVDQRQVARKRQFHLPSYGYYVVIKLRQQAELLGLWAVGGEGETCVFSEKLRSQLSIKQTTHGSSPPWLYSEDQRRRYQRVAP